jgi:phosphoesterase RecJ-like protein
MLTALRRTRRALVTTHKHPDVDGISSALALGWGLKRFGAEVQVVSPGGVPHEAAFLPGVESLVPSPSGRFDTAIFVDCPSMERAGLEPGAVAGAIRLNIDHHETNALYGDVNYVRPSMAASAQLVLRLLMALGLAVNPQVATWLLAGLYGDTQGLRTASTDLRALRDATALVEAGADAAVVARGIFGSLLHGQLRLWGRVLAGVEECDGITWATIDRAAWAEAGVPEGEDGGLANFLLGTQGTAVAALFQESSDGRVRVSLRSNPGVDVAAVAARFGGGGHRQAAGCTLEMSLEEARGAVIASLKRALHESRRGVTAG